MALWTSVCSFRFDVDTSRGTLIAVVTLYYTQTFAISSFLNDRGGGPSCRLRVPQAVELCTLYSPHPVTCLYYQSFLRNSHPRLPCSVMRQSLHFAVSPTESRNWHRLEYV